MVSTNRLYAWTFLCKFLWRTAGAQSTNGSPLPSAQPATVQWKYPLLQDRYIVILNLNDTVELEWTSSVTNPLLTLWCRQDRLPVDPDYVSWFSQAASQSGSKGYIPFQMSGTDKDWNRGGFECVWNLASRQDRSTAQPEGPTMKITSIQSRPSTVFARSFTSVVSGSSVQISLITNSARTNATISSPISTNPPTGMSNPSDLDGSNAPASRLSSSVKAGIAIGATVGVLLLAGVLVLMYRKNRNMNRRIEELEVLQYGSNGRFDRDKATWSCHEIADLNLPQEMATRDTIEMEAGARAGELDSV